jgi:hypothetical protein
VLTPGSSWGEDSLISTPGVPPGKGSVTLTSEPDPGAPTKPIGQDREPGGEIASIVGTLGPDADWWKPFSEYLQRGTIPDDEIETWCLARQAKGYLIHNNGLYHCSASGNLQRCIPTEEGKALLLDNHEGVCGHHPSSRSMDGKTF